MMCCGGKNRPNPSQGTTVDCNGQEVRFEPRAYVIAVKNSMDLCSFTGTGADGLVTYLDVERALGRR